MLPEIVQGQRLQTLVQRREDVAGARGVVGPIDAAVAADPHLRRAAWREDNGVDIGMNRIADIGVGSGDARGGHGDLGAIDCSGPIAARKNDRPTKINPIGVVRRHGDGQVVPDP